MEGRFMGNYFIGVISLIGTPLEEIYEPTPKLLVQI